MKDCLWNLMEQEVLKSITSSIILLWLLLMQYHEGTTHCDWHELSYWCESWYIKPCRVFSWSLIYFRLHLIYLEVRYIMSYKITSWLLIMVYANTLRRIRLYLMDVKAGVLNVQRFVLELQYVQLSSSYGRGSALDRKQFKCVHNSCIQCIRTFCERYVINVCEAYILVLL